MARSIALVAALAFIALFGGLTARVALTDGVTPLVVVAVIVLALFAFGIVGALWRPPDR